MDDESSLQLYLKWGSLSFHYLGDTHFSFSILFYFQSVLFRFYPQSVLFRNSSAIPFISCQNVHFHQTMHDIVGSLFHVGHPLYGNNCTIISAWLNCYSISVLFPFLCCDASLFLIYYICLFVSIKHLSLNINNTMKRLNQNKLNARKARLRICKVEFTH